MRRSFPIVLVLIFGLLPGCLHRRAARPPVPPPVSAPVLAGQKAKDEAVTAHATEAKALAPIVTPQADAILAAVAAAPAAEVEALVEQFEATLAERDATIARLQRDLAAARDATDRVIRLGGYALAALLVAAGVASFFFAAQVPWLGPRFGSALATAGAAIFVLVQAYEWTKAHPWITGLVLLPLAAAGALAYANHWHSRREGGAA